MNDYVFKILKENYRLLASNVVELSGGWLNKKFLVETKDKKFVLKIMSNKKVEKMSNSELSISYIDARFLLSLKIEEALFCSGINCPNIIRDINGGLISNIADERCFLMEYIGGKMLNNRNINSIQLSLLGKECAKMHLQLEKYDSLEIPGEYLSLPTISKLKSNYVKKVRMSKDSNLKIYLELLEKQFAIINLIESSSLISEIPISIIHGDFANDNIIFIENKPYIIDFELIRKNSPLQDIGRIIMSFCYDGMKMDIKKIAHFLKGYNSVKKITYSDLALSFMVVWLNEVDMWIKKSYFEKDITEKASRFKSELIFITNNFQDIYDFYVNQKESEIVKIKKQGK